MPVGKQVCPSKLCPGGHCVPPIPAGGPIEEKIGVKAFLIESTIPLGGVGMGVGFASSFPPKPRRLVIDKIGDGPPVGVGVGFAGAEMPGVEETENGWSIVADGAGLNPPIGVGAGRGEGIGEVLGMGVTGFGAVCLAGTDDTEKGSS